MSSAYEERILRVLRYIHDNPAGDLSLDALADVAAMSRFHWHRVFQAMTGETCAEAVRRLRLYRAARWLIIKDWPVEKIASRVGYANVKSFSRIFQDCYGVSPNAFRKRDCPNLKLKLGKIGDNQMFDIEIKNAPGRRLGAIRHKGPYTGIGDCFQQLFEGGGEHDAQSRTQGVIGVYYDDPSMVAETDLRSAAGLIIDDNLPLPMGLEEIQLASGKHAVLTYKGPYEGIKVAYDHLFGHWLPGSNHEPADEPCYESYLNSPMDTKPAELLTEIYLPLAA